MALNQKNARTCALHIYITSHPIFLHVLVHNGSLSGNQTKVILHEIKLVLFYMVLLWFNSLMMVPCWPKHVGIFGVRTSWCILLV